MLYSFLKIWLQVALKFYIKNIKLRAYQIEDVAQPSILAVNHPNSFLDALIVCAYYPKQIYFLARGDAFNKKWAAWILRKLHMIPIHRMEEGRENLSKNDESFDEVMKIFKQGGTVLIFPEGVCKNQHTIRHLRKGAARLALQAWQEKGIHHLIVEPVRLQYASFQNVPKSVALSFAEPLAFEDFEIEQEANFYNDFNEVLKKRLESQPSVVENKIKTSALAKIILTLPAFLGFIIHHPFYVLWRNFVAKKTRGTVFYDSVLFAGMMLLYPFFVLLMSAAVVVISANHFWWLLLVILPCLAWCYKLYKETSH